MKRRELLKGATVAGLAGALAKPLQALSPPPVIDAHIHLFDPTRPGGVPWPEAGDVIYKPALLSRYEPLAAPFGVVGAIAIEASPLPSDNDWLLHVVERNPLMVGMIGDLVPGAADFGRELERLHRNSLFLGIRYGNLWNRNLLRDKDGPGFMDGLKMMAQAKLVLEVANPDADLIEAVHQIAGRIADLTIVIDHLPHALEPANSAERKSYHAHLAELGKRAGTFVKLSEIVTVTDGKVDRDAAAYARKLDPLWEMFGPDRVIFGSDWPNSDHVANLADTFSVVQTYVAGKGTTAARKYFANNSQQAYRWEPRRANQRL